MELTACPEAWNPLNSIQGFIIAQYIMGKAVIKIQPFDTSG